jgi:hypothetical protein
MIPDFAENADCFEANKTVANAVTAKDDLFGTWDRCYDYNFRRFFAKPIFGEKPVFFSKTNVMNKFLQKLAVV